MITAVYPGSFDPITYGHIDVARRAANIFGKVIIAVFDKPMKVVTFSLEESKYGAGSRKDIPNIEVRPLQACGRFCKEVNANVMVRGLRSAPISSASSIWQ